MFSTINWITTTTSVDPNLWLHPWLWLRQPYGYVPGPAWPQVVGKEGSIPPSGHILPYFPSPTWPEMLGIHVWCQECNKLYLQYERLVWMAMHGVRYWYLSISIPRNKIFPFSYGYMYGIYVKCACELLFSPVVVPRLCSTTHQQIYCIS